MCILSKIKKSKKLKTVFILIAIVIFFPVKIAKTSLEGNQDKEYKETYIVEYHASSLGLFIASETENPHINESLDFLEFTGKTPYFYLNSKFTKQEMYPDDAPWTNKYIIKGYKYDLGGSYGFYVEDWEIMYPIRRENVLTDTLLPCGYLTITDYNWKNVFENLIMNKEVKTRYSNSAMLPDDNATQ